MILIKDPYHDSVISTCENCGKTEVRVRPIESLFSLGHYYKVCYVCSAPTVQTRTSEGRIVNSPVTNTETEKK